MDLVAWVYANIAQEGTWPTTFAFGIWWLWKWRCARTFCTDFLITSPRAEFIVDRANEYRHLLGRRNNGRSSGADANWGRPPVGLSKLNTDGSYKAQSSFICAGGLVRNHNGDFIGGFTTRKARNSPCAAELLGIREGLKLAKEYNITQLQVETDSLEAFELISADSATSVVHREQIYFIKTMVADLSWLVHFSFVPCLANRAADWLAKLGNTSTEPYVRFTTPLEELTNFIELDVMLSTTM